MSIKKMDGVSQPPQVRLLEVLREHCPEVFTEGKVDPAKLTATLGPEVSGERERYGLSWAGKNDCFGHIQEPTTATLRPCREESVDFDATENLFIEGDNLQVLKILQKSYYGRVKMIYIDPPYNTGSDSFIYPDKFQESETDYLRRAGATDEEGNLIRDGFWRKNSRDRGHFHSNWLTMMYPRLFLARNLLRPDGVIFVSIDDNEVHNLRMIMNEIFGEENFIASIIWQHSIQPKGYIDNFSVHHNYLLVYQKTDAFQLIALERTDEHNKHYTNPDNDPKGPWRSGDVRNALYRPNLIFNIKTPSGKDITPPKNGWRWSKQTIDKKIKDGEIVFNNEETKIIRKIYLQNVQGRAPETIWHGKEAGTTREANQEIKAIFESNPPFDTPKPIGLIRKVINISCEDDDIVLDFFAGSCTTAHAAMQLNAEDGGSRKFICIQLPEPCEDGSEAKKAGFKNIADIGKERIRRAAKKIAEDQNGKLDFEGDKPDLGFKVLKLSESSFKEWRGDVKTGAQLAKQMGLFTDPVKEGAQPEDMLFELILKSGLDLNVPVEVKKHGKKSYYHVDGGRLIVCLEEKITQALAEKIIAEKPRKVLCLDRGFAGDDQLKTNTALQMEAEGIEFKVI